MSKEKKKQQQQKYHISKRNMDFQTGLWNGHAV